MSMETQVVFDHLNDLKKSGKTATEKLLARELIQMLLANKDNELDTQLLSSWKLSSDVQQIVDRVHGRSRAAHQSICDTFLMRRPVAKA